MDELKEQLTCPNCLHFLDSQIYVCSSGHNACRKCRKNDKCSVCQNAILPIRNLALEKIMKDLMVHCPNVQYGCKKLLIGECLDEHLEKCEYREYECGIDKQCPWRGSWWQLKKHYYYQHPFDVCVGSKIACFWSSSQAESSVKVMLVFNNIFYVHRVLKNGIMNWTVQCAGRPQDAILFGFQVEVYSEEYKNRFLRFIDNCHPFAGHVADIVEEGYCAAIPLTILESFKNSLDVITYSIRIVKT